MKEKMSKHDSEKPREDSTSSFNECGEIISNRPDQKGPEYPPALQLTILYEGMAGGNVLPPGFENPNKLIYYNQRHIEESKNLIKEINRISEQNKIEFLMGWNKEQSLPVEQVVERIKKSIDFSEKIHEQISANTTVENTSQLTEEELAKKRRALRDKLRNI